MGCESMIVETASTGMRKALATNSTASSFAAKIPTATEPTSDGVHTMGFGDSSCRSNLLVMPYAVASDNNTFSVQVWAWEFISQGDTRLWIPRLLCQVACTVDSTLVGVAGRAIVATEMFADTLSVSIGEENVNVAKCSPADGNSAGHFMVDIQGAPKVEFVFSTGSSATSCNAAFRPL